MIWKIYAEDAGYTQRNTVSPSYLTFTWSRHIVLISWENHVITGGQFFPLNAQGKDLKDKRDQKEIAMRKHLISITILTLCVVALPVCDNDVLNPVPLGLNHYTMTFNDGNPIEVYIENGTITEDVVCNDPLMLECDVRVTKYEIIYERETGFVPLEISHRVNWLISWDGTRSFCFSIFPHELTLFEYDWREGEILKVHVRYSGVEADSGNQVLIKGVATLRIHA
jgi:hypothetical protein